jgi:hypothetical protein
MGKGVTIRDTLPQDVLSLCNRLREADIREMTAQGFERENYFFVVMEGLSNGLVCKTGLSPLNEVGCIFGILNTFNVIQTGPFSYYNYMPIWLLGTDLIDKYAITFLRMSKPYLRQMKKLTPGQIPLGNWVHDENTLHRKWLKWAGFKEMTRAVYNSEPFTFYLHDEEVVNNVPSDGNRGDRFSREHSGAICYI